MTPKDPDLPPGEEEIPGLFSLPLRRSHDPGLAGRGDGEAGAGQEIPAGPPGEGTGSGAIYDRVSVLLEGGRLGEAEGLLRRGLEIYPESVELLKELGVLYHLQGRYGKAARTFTRVMNITGEGKQSLSWRIASLHSKALEELAGPDPAVALPTFDQILALEPGNREALAGRIAALRILGRTEEAWRCAKEGLALDPPGASITYQEGWLHMEGDRPDLAEAAFGRASRADPAWPEPVFSRGFALIRLGRGPEAGQLVRDYVEAAGSPPGLRAALGWFSLALRDPGTAKEIFRRLGGEEDDPGGFHGLAAVLLALGSAADAGVILEKLASSFPRDALVQVNRGMVLARGPGARDLADAAIAAKRALSLSPGLAPAHSCLGIVAWREGKPEDAEAHLALALRLSDPAGERNLGLLLCARGRWEEAETRLLRATRLDPLDARAWAGLGAAALHRGEPEEGLRHLRRAHLLDPWNTATARGLSLALAGAGARDEAEEVIRRSLPLVPGPGRWPLQLELAAILVSGGGPGGDPVLDEEAGGILAAAGELRPGDPGILFYRGIVEARLGHKGDAMELFTRCLESGEYRAPAHENIRRLKHFQRAGRGAPGWVPPARTALAIVSLLQLAAGWFLFVARLISEAGFLLLLGLFSILLALQAFFPMAHAGGKQEHLPDLLLPARTFVPVPESDMVSPFVRLRTALRPRTESIPRT